MADIATREWHRVLLGTTPSAVQQTLYQQYPQVCGYSSSDRNPELLEAVSLLALRSGSAEDRPLILAPIAMEAWVLEGIEQMAINVFQRCRHSPKLLKGYTQLFQKLQLTGRVLQLPGEPKHWVSIGFSIGDVIPDWMRGKLLNLL